MDLLDSEGLGSEPRDQGRRAILEQLAVGKYPLGSGGQRPLTQGGIVVLAHRQDAAPGRGGLLDRPNRIVAARRQIDDDRVDAGQCVLELGAAPGPSRTGPDRLQRADQARLPDQVIRQDEDVKA